MSWKDQFRELEPAMSKICYFNDLEEINNKFGFNSQSFKQIQIVTDAITKMEENLDSTENLDDLDKTVKMLDTLMNESAVEIKKYLKDVQEVYAHQVAFRITLPVPEKEHELYNKKMDTISRRYYRKIQSVIEFYGSVMEVVKTLLNTELTRINIALEGDTDIQVKKYRMLDIEYLKDRWQTLEDSRDFIILNCPNTNTDVVIPKGKVLEVLKTAISATLSRREI